MLFFKLVFKEIYHLFKNRNTRTFLWLAFWYGGRKRYQSTQVKFFKYRFQVPDCLSFIFQFKEIFAEEYYCFHTSKNNPLIYDCGANIGMSCLYFKTLYPNAIIKAFEADAKIADILKENLAKNQISGVEIIPKAVWENDKGIEISLEGADGASIFGEGQKMQIPSLRLKDFIENETEIDMLKMDIEGAETVVLADCSEALQKIKHIFIEYHAYLHQAQELDKILKTLTDNGFRYFIKNALDRPQPLVNQRFKNDNSMDLQLNIFGYRA